MRHILSASAALLVLACPSLLHADTVAYRYDAHGRLIQAARSGGINNGVVTAYAFDRADNRVQRRQIGGPPCLLTVALNGGFHSIPIRRCA